MIESKDMIRRFSYSKKIVVIRQGHIPLLGDGKYGFGFSMLEKVISLTSICISSILVLSSFWPQSSQLLVEKAAQPRQLVVHIKGICAKAVKKD